MKTCTISGCDKPYRARGLCSTHYNHTHQPHRHASTDAPCTICGVMVARPKRSDRRPVCSPECRLLLWATPSGRRYDWAADAARRARNAGAVVVEIFTREEIFERDAWTCQLCGAHLSSNTDPFDPEAPTVDHVVSLAHGGEHSRANAQAACLHCNSSKQAA